MRQLDELALREYHDLVDEGERLLEEGNLVEAKNRFERAKTLFDDLMAEEARRLDEFVERTYRGLIELNVAEGDRLKAQGEREAARERYALALSLCHDPAERDELLIKMEIQAPMQPESTFSESVQRLFAAADAAPESPEALYALATELAIEGYPLEAIRYLERVVTLAPDDADPLFRLGNALTDVDELERAEAAYRKALDLGYDPGEIQFRLGEVARRGGDHALAEERYLAALKVNDGDVDAVRALARLYDVDEKPRQAVDWLERSVKLDPEDSSSFLRLGELYEAEGRNDEARRCWQRAAKADPESEGAAFARERLAALDLPDAERDGDGDAG